MQKKKVPFQPPGKAKRLRALGNMKGEDRKCQKALDNIDEYWTQIRKPTQGDWLYPYGHNGQTYDNFRGKKIDSTKNVLYILPIVYNKGSLITDGLLEQMKQWLSAFYSPCKVVI